MMKGRSRAAPEDEMLDLVLDAVATVFLITLYSLPFILAAIIFENPPQPSPPMETPQNQLAPPKPQPIGYGQTGIKLQSFEDAQRFGKMVAESGFAPKGMENVASVVIAIQFGAELGLPPMASLQSIAVINGRPGIYGDCALGLVRSSGLCEAYSQKESGTGEEMAAVVTVKRHGEEPIVSTFSVADAKKAGLWGKSGPWSQYPKRMLMFRARGFALRDAFPDVLKGLRTTEELGDIEVETTIETPKIKLGPIPAKPLELKVVDSVPAPPTVNENVTAEQSSVPQGPAVMPFPGDEIEGLERIRQLQQQHGFADQELLTWLVMSGVLRGKHSAAKEIDQIAPSLIGAVCEKMPDFIAFWGNK